MVDEETVKRLDHVSVIDLGRFTTVIDQFELVLGLFSSHVFTGKFEGRMRRELTLSKNANCLAEVA